MSKKIINVSDEELFNIFKDYIKEDHRDYYEQFLKGSNKECTIEEAQKFWEEKRNNIRKELKEKKRYGIKNDKKSNK